MSVGWTRTPSLAIVAYTLAICTALTEMPWPYDRVYRVVGRPLRRRRQGGRRVRGARLLARQAEAGRLAEPERLQVVVLRLRGDVPRHLGHADVGGVRDDAGDRVPLARRPLGVVDGLPAPVEHVRDVVGAHRRLAAALERGGGGDHLGGGARLEQVLVGQVVRVGHVRQGGLVVGGPLGHGEDGAGLRLDDDDRAVLRLGLGDLLLARLLRLELQRGDDRQPDGRAVLGGLCPRCPPAGSARRPRRPSPARCRWCR